MGNTPEIPKVFKTGSRVRNKNVTKRQTEMMVKEIWKARMTHRKAGKAGVDLPEMIFLHLQKTKGLHQAVIEVLHTCTDTHAQTHRHMHAFIQMHPHRCIHSDPYRSMHACQQLHTDYHTCLSPASQPLDSKYVFNFIVIGMKTYTRCKDRLFFATCKIKKGNSCPCIYLSV